jgi:hypothetical protein
MMNVIKFQKDMRTYIRIAEQANADDMYGDIDPVTFGHRNGETFSDHGRGDLKVKPNDPRFSDNPMAYDQEEIDEFADAEITPELEQLHQALTGAGLTDLEIRQGVDLTHGGKEKIAAKLGIGAHEVDTLLNSLTQNLRDDDASSTDALLSDYYTGMSEGADAPIWAGRLAETKHRRDHKRPFDVGTMFESRFSVEPDSLGNITIRDQETGKEKFVQGTDASAILAKLKNADSDVILSPLMEANMNTEDPSSGFADEINADSGSYNFEWTYLKSRGTGTIIYSMKANRPNFQMASVRDQAGNDITDHLDTSEYRSIMKQAKDFIGQA